MVIQQYLKAITAAIIAGLGTLAVAYNDNKVTNKEWVDIAISFFVALGGVWAVPNAVKKIKVNGSSPPTEV